MFMMLCPCTSWSTYILIRIITGPAGAYYAYTKFAEEAGFTPVAQEDMEKKSIPGLLGLLYDITQEPVLEQNPDSVEYFIIPGDYECQVMYQGSDEWLETSMLAEYAEGANAYGVFLGRG